MVILITYKIFDMTISRIYMICHYIDNAELPRVFIKILVYFYHVYCNLRLYLWLRCECHKKIESAVYPSLVYLLPCTLHGGDSCKHKPGKISPCFYYSIFSDSVFYSQTIVLHFLISFFCIFVYLCKLCICLNSMYC